MAKTRALHAQHSNQEGEDLEMPLPIDWDLLALRKERLTLYQSKISPPCCKIRFLLAFYEVPFKTVLGPKPNSDYKKIPVLDIGDRIQVNDSFIIAKSLSPILQGRPLKGDELEIEWEVTYGLMPALEVHAAGSISDLCACAALLGGTMGCALRTFACSLCCAAPRKISEGKDLRTVPEYGDMLRDRLNGFSFFGGDSPNVLDVSAYGVLEPFARVQSSCVDCLLGPPGDVLREWHNRMKDKSKHVDIFQ
jgi:glutathione S-transferase